MNKNIRYIITYVLAVLFVLFAALFYRQSVLTALFLLMLVLPVISLALCYFAKESVRIDFDTLPLTSSSGPGMKLHLRLIVKNTGYVPLLNCAVSFLYRNRFYKAEKQNALIFAAPPKSVRNYEFLFDTPFPGMFELNMHTLLITDFLHMKTWTIPFDRSVKTALLPQETDVEDIQIYKAPLEEDAERSFTGEISREVRQVREYAPGDKLRDMHWKQTARLDTPMVREFERMRESFYVLYPVPVKDEENTFEKSLSLWYSLALKLIRDGETVYTVVFDPEGRSYEKYRAASEDELVRTVYELYNTDLLPDADAAGFINRLTGEIPAVTVIYRGSIRQAET